MRQAGVIAAAGLVALDEMVDRLADDHAHARRLGDHLAALPGLKVYPVWTNMVFFEVVDDRLTWVQYVAAAHQAGVRVAKLGHGRLRAVLHSGISIQDVDRAAEILASLLA